MYITSHNNTHYKLVTSTYELGTRFQGKFVVHDGVVAVSAKSPCTAWT